MQSCSNYLYRSLMSLKILLWPKPQYLCLLLLSLSTTAMELCTRHKHQLRHINKTGHSLSLAAYARLTEPLCLLNWSNHTNYDRNSNTTTYSWLRPIPGLCDCASTALTRMQSWSRHGSSYYRTGSPRTFIKMAIYRRGNSCDSRNQVRTGTYIKP